jgi:hypothetical protein
MACAGIEGVIVRRRFTSGHARAFGIRRTGYAALILVGFHRRSSTRPCSHQVFADGHLGDKSAIVRRVAQVYFEHRRAHDRAGTNSGPRRIRESPCTRRGATHRRGGRPGAAIPGQWRPGTVRPCGAFSLTTSIFTNAHFGHSNDRNPSVLVSSLMGRGSWGRFFRYPSRHENITRTRVKRKGQ